MTFRKRTTAFLLCIVTLTMTIAQTIVETFENEPLHRALSVKEGAEAKIEDGSLYLRSEAGGHRAAALQTEGSIPNAAYSFSVDFFPISEAMDGYAFQFMHRDEADEQAIWYVELTASGRAGIYSIQNGEWRPVRSQSDCAFDIWYRLEIENREDHTRIRLTERETGRVLFDLDNVAHDPLPGGRIRIVPNAGGAKYKANLSMRIENFQLDVKDGGARLRPAAERSMSDQARPLLESDEGISVWGESDGRLFFLRDGKAWGTVKPEIQLDGHAAPVEVDGEVELDSQTGTFTARWVVEDGGVEIALTGELMDNGEGFRGHAKATNLDGEEKWVRMVLPFEYSKEHGPATDQIAFQKRWIREMRPVDFPLPTLGVETRADYGTWIFGWGSRVGMVSDDLTGQLRSDEAATTDMYIPMLCGYNEKGGVAVFVNPRNAWGFAWSPQRQILTRRFYLPAEEGFSVSGFDDGAGDGEIPYEFFVHLTPEPDWGDLYNHLYLPQFPFLTQPATVEVPTGAKGNFWNWDDDDWEEQLDAYVMPAGIRVLHGFETFTPEGFGRQGRDIPPELMPRLREKGISTYLWTNIRMVPHVGFDGRMRDPEYQYSNFPDALSRNQQGEIYQSWSGYSVNHSPKFSFGHYQLKRLIEEVERYDLDGVFMDYYDDTVQVDWGRSYKHYPFYPLNVASIEFTRALTEKLHARGKYFITNAPNASLIVNQFSDAYASDGDDQDSVFWYRLQLPHKPFINLGNPTKLDGGRRLPKGEQVQVTHWHDVILSRTHFGAIPSIWSSRGHPGSAPSASVWGVSNPNLLLDLFSRNIVFWELMADAHILGGGDPYRELHHDLHEGRFAISFRNPTDEMMEVVVTVPERFPLGDTTYSLLEWSLTDGPRMLLENQSPEQMRAYTSTRFVRPQGTRFFVMASSADMPGLLDRLQSEPERSPLSFTPDNAHP